MNSSWGYDWSAAFNIYAAVPTDGSGAVETGFLNRPTVAKKSGAVVGARLFCEPQSSGVSGVLFSDIGIWNAPREIGTDLIFVHNPMAAARSHYKRRPGAPTVASGTPSPARRVHPAWFRSPTG
ncbi:MAG: hypothetical protein IPI67_30225 [Myxococcales bacterium]|nr:hypothetical protein [Myxococcales bacterium]